MQTMYRAALLSGYPQCDDRNISYNVEARNEPGTHRLLSAGRSLAAGPLKGLDALLTSIIEAKDVPATLKGILQFAKFVYRVGRRRTQVLSKTTVREVTAAYLNWKYGILPTISDIERFLISLPDELAKARTHLDAMFEASANSIRRSSKDFHEWLKDRAQRDRERALLREQALRIREAERKLRHLRHDRIAKQIQMLKKLRDSLRNERDEYRHRLLLDLDKTRYQLYDTFITSDDLRLGLDELYAERQDQLNAFFAKADDIIDDREALYAELDHMRYLTVAYPARYQDFDRVQNDITMATMELDRLRQERSIFLDLVSEAKQRLLNDLQDAYAMATSQQDYLAYLNQRLSDTSAYDISIDNVEHDINKLYEEAKALSKRIKRRRSTSLNTSSTKLTREYVFPDIYVSARKMLFREPGGVRIATTIPTEPMEYTVTYSVHDGRVEPSFSDAISGIVKDAITHLFKGELRTICSSALVYKQWPFEFLTGYFTPFGRLCDFAHSFIQPFQTAWALVPWSFCIDWIVDLSSTMEALEAEFTRRALGLPEAQTWAALTYRALLATNLDNPIPVSIEQEWLSDPGAIAPTHTVRYTVKLGTHFNLWGLSSDAFIRRVEQSSGVSEFLPPVGFQNIVDHSLEGLALLTQQLVK
jgi:hypothetical protein